MKHQRAMTVPVTSVHKQPTCIVKQTSKPQAQESVPELRLGELVPQRDNHGRNAENGDHCDVDEHGLRTAVEAVVDPRNERTDDQESDPSVVEPGRKREMDGKNAPTTYVGAFLILSTHKLNHAHT